MISDSQPPESGEARLDQLVTEYLEAVEAGKAPNREEWLSRHADLAADLRTFFTNHDRLAKIGAPLRQVMPWNGPGAATGQASTLLPGGAPIASAALQRVRSFGDYELLEEIARGGMGVIYKARQVSLNRIVALKMILAGQLASQADLARFLAEAEAVAQLRHPNIVQIYERGHRDGLPYFTLEFMEGGSLTAKLAGTPLPPSEAALLVEKLTRGVQYAHSHGIIHRDLKPSNVLLAADGTPRITDFGLAKRVERASDLTRTGAIMGTPSYMAPEQASGKKATTTASDVYALGAILYECLTGRPPFRAATPLETILQVLNDEPVPPSYLQGKTPRDLETICLKCLDKDPVRRYATAEALADDLCCFLEKRPIAARPVGRVERAAKLVRRNPLISAAALAVASVLLIGTAVSTYFGISASNEAARARTNEADALAARNELASANVTLERSRHDLEITLAQSWLRPLALRGTDQPMTEGEWQAVWELASNRGILSLRFVEEALRSPRTTRQLRDRAALALPAAVGLDSERRAQVEGLLVARLKDPSLDDEQKNDVALAAAAWDGLSQAGADRVARHLSQALAHSQEFGLYWLGQGLAAAAARLDAAHAPAAAAFMVQAMQETRDPNVLSLFCQALAAMKQQLPKQEAGRAAAVIVAHMKNGDPMGWQLVGLLPGLTAYAEPREADRIHAEAATAIVQIMRSNDRGAPWLAWSLPQLTLHRDAKVALQLREAAEILLSQMKSGRDSADLGQRPQTLAALLAAMPGDEATAAATQAVAILVRAAEDSKDSGVWSQVAWGFNALASFLPAERRAAVAAQLAAGLLQRMMESADPSTKQSSAQSLANLAPALEAKEAATISAQIAALLSQAVKDSREPWTLRSLAQALAAVASRRPAGDALRTLLQAMIETPDNNVRSELIQNFPRVMPDIQSSDAAKAANLIIEHFQEVKDLAAMSALAPALISLAGRLEAGDAVLVAEKLAKAIDDAKDVPSSLALVQPLAALTARLELRRADSITAPLAAVLLESLRAAKDKTQMDPLANGLGTILPRIESKRAADVSAQAASVLVAAMKDARNTGAAAQLAQSLVPLAPFLDADEALPLADLVAQLMRDSRDINFAISLARLLAAMTPHLKAADAAARLTQAMKDTSDRNALQLLTPLAAGLQELAQRLATPDAVRAAIVLLQVLKDQTGATQEVADCLRTLLSSVDPAQVPARCSVVASAAILPLGAGQMLDAVITIMPAAAPFPCRATTQELVELLKMPTCVGPVQRVVLDHLGNRFDHSFRDPWEFVTFANDRGLELDWLSPPQRLELAPRTGL